MKRAQRYRLGATPKVMSSVFRHAIEKSRLPRMQSRHAEKVLPRVFGDASRLDRVCVGVSNGELNQAEIEGVTRCPDHTGDRVL
jgi:hypothetical protein